MFSYKKKQQAIEHAETKGEEIMATKRDIDVSIETTKKNLKRLNKVLDNGITLKIKTAMGGKHHG